MTMGRSGFARVGRSALMAMSALSAGLLAAVLAPSHTLLDAQATIPDLAGKWDGGGRARRVNSETVPWGKENFPELNERGLAYQKVFEEIISPKYDCQPSTSPALQYDPYNMEVIQQKDRVIFNYEKDDQQRVVWLDGRTPTAKDFSLQGFSTGKYENGALNVVTTHFVWDVTGFDDYNGIPSSSQKKVTERVLARGKRAAAHAHHRRSDVPEEAHGVHHALAVATQGFQAPALRLRSGVRPRVGAVLPVEIQVRRTR